MILKAICKLSPQRGRLHTKTLLVMKFLAFFILVACLHANANGYAQKISFSETNSSLKDVFKSIEKQSSYQFFYNERLLKRAQKVSLDIRNATVEEVLAAVFKDQPLSYAIVKNTIIVKAGKIDSPEDELAPITVRGRITGPGEIPIENASIIIKGTRQGTNTNANGDFVLNNVEETAVLVVSSIGYEPREINVQSRTTINVELSIAVTGLDETVVIAYGTTSKRLNTGSVSSVTSEILEKQPVSDPLAALQGRVAGLMITPSSGMPGSSFQVRVRGENSIKQGSDPLFVVDGVPYFSSPLNMFTGANGNQSPLNSINPADIERIDVLKDADATAIYGSRAANGVVLITTKKGRAGESKVDISLYTGFSKVSNKLDLMNTQQYLEMRRDAFRLDGATPTEQLAPDLLTWDQNAYTDFQDLLIGSTAPMSEARVAFSGGNAQTRFMLSGTYRNEGTVILGDFRYKRGAIHLSADHSSRNGKFSVNGSVNIAMDENNLVPTDVSQYIFTAPNFPLHNPDGSLYFFGTGQNPLAFLNQNYETKTNNLIGNSVLRYTILPGLTARANLGFTRTAMNQLLTLPAAGFNPATYTGSSSQFGNSTINSFVAEPQLDYNVVLGPGRLNVLAGASWQQSTAEGRFLQGAGYSSDALLENIGSATSVTVRSINQSQYNYQSVFGRINYNMNEKYLLNLTFRRDGSSRFGPGRQFGNFGAVGAAWIFTQENFISDALPFLSFGKLRGSVGTTGNDQIGDYQYLDTWGSTSFPYGGISGLNPTRVYNPDYSWEINKKLELALELGFLQDRILFSASYYRNRSSNQLIGYTLSPQSGFTSYTANLPAKVQNSGLEFSLNTTNIKNADFSWTTDFNLSIARNKLLQYDNIEKTADAASFVVGKSIRIIKGYHFLGINPQTGIPEFLDVDKDGAVSTPNDQVIMGETMPAFFGGISNQLNYKRFSLDFFFQFVKQESISMDWGPLVGVPGSMTNKEISYLNRWKQPGDITDIPRPSATSTDPSNAAFRNFYRSSDAAWGDASYIRLKNISLSYDLSPVVERWKLQGATVFVQGQNLLTFTNYNGLDPEINGFDRRFVFPINPFGSVRTQAIPVLKSFTAGVRLTL